MLCLKKRNQRRRKLHFWKSRQKKIIIMKTLFFLLCIFSLFIISCTNNEDDNIIEPKEESMIYYKNSPNLSDGLIAKYTDENKSEVYLYGTTNQYGNGSVLKSAVYKKANSDTLINVVFDQQNRPKLSYLSTSTGFKSKFIVKFDFDNSSDSVKVDYFKYNWETAKDSLFASYKYKNQNGVVYYGNKTTSKNTDAAYVLAIGGAVIIGVLCPIAAGWAVANLVGWGSFLGSISGAFTTVWLASSVWTTNLANAATLNNIPMHPQSPTSGTIPNPVGTPQNPNGTNQSQVSLYSIECSNGCIYQLPVGTILNVEIRDSNYSLITTVAVKVQNHNFVAICGSSNMSNITLPSGNYHYSWFNSNLGGGISSTFTVTSGNCTNVKISLG